jgi:hypothetical protein
MANVEPRLVTPVPMSDAPAARKAAMLSVVPAHKLCHHLPVKNTATVGQVLVHRDELEAGATSLRYQMYHRRLVVSRERQRARQRKEI